MPEGSGLNPKPSSRGRLSLAGLQPPPPTPKVAEQPQGEGGGPLDSRP